MIKHFGIFAGVIAMVAGNADITPEKPILEKQEVTKNVSVYEETLKPKTTFDLSVGSRSDFLTDEQNKNFGTLGGVIGFTLNPVYVEADGYYGRTYSGFTEAADREDTASIHGKVGGVIAFTEKENYKVTPFLGYGYDSTWQSDADFQNTWVGPLVGAEFTANPTEKLMAKVSYSHHFLDFKNQVNQLDDFAAFSGNTIANAHGEKVGVDFKYALSKALDLGLGASYLYFYKNENDGELKGDATLADGSIEAITRTVATPSSHWHGVLATGRLTYNF